MVKGLCRGTCVEEESPCPLGLGPFELPLITYRRRLLRRPTRYQVTKLKDVRSQENKKIYITGNAIITTTTTTTTITIIANKREAVSDLLLPFKNSCRSPFVGMSCPNNA